MSNIQIKDIKSIYKVNDVCMAYKDLFSVCQYVFIITAQAYFSPLKMVVDTSNTQGEFKIKTLFYLFNITYTYMYLHILYVLNWSNLMY